MDEETKAKTFRVMCSFCGKDQATVKKMIAGPAVAICNECVALCDGIIAQSPDGPPETPFDVATHFRSLESERLLGLVGSSEKTFQQVSEQQQLLVDILREREISWSAIGQSLGVTRQAAWRRFASPPD
jgi:hypothetical protein